LKPWADEQKNCPHDEAPLALMRANPWARVTEIIGMNGRPRNSTVSSLKRRRRSSSIGAIALLNELCRQRPLILCRIELDLA
jgi:hypothetical protein